MVVRFVLEYTTWISGVNSKEKRVKEEYLMNFTMCISIFLRTKLDIRVVQLLNINSENAFPNTTGSALENSLNSTNAKNGFFQKSRTVVENSMFSLHF